MRIVPHFQAVGVRRTTGPNRQTSTGLRSCADPGGHATFRAVSADSAAEASDVPAAVGGSNRPHRRGQDSKGGEMTSKRIRRITGWVLAPLLVAGAVAAQAGAASAATTVTGVTTGPCTSRHHAWPWGADRSCRSARFRTIQSAVNAARPGSTVVVCPGTYHEQVVVSKPLSLQGQRATIDETGVTPTFQVNTAGSRHADDLRRRGRSLSSDIRFSGFTVTHALGEGILAAGLWPATITRHLDQPQRRGAQRPRRRRATGRRPTSNARRRDRCPATAARAFTCRRRLLADHAELHRR